MGLTNDQRKAVDAQVRQTGAERLRIFGDVGRDRFSEPDFLAGAAAAVFALTGDMADVPPMWFLGGPMVGRSIVDPDGSIVRELKDRRAAGRRAARSRR